MSNHNDSEAQIDLLLQQCRAVPDSQPLAERIIVVSRQAEQYLDSPPLTTQKKNLFSKLSSNLGINFGLEKYASPMALAAAVILIVVVFSANILTPPNGFPNKPSNGPSQGAQQIGQNTSEINNDIVNTMADKDGLTSMINSEEFSAAQMELAQLDSDEFSWDALLLMQDEMSFAQL